MKVLHKGNEKGFTLLEMAIVMLLGSIVFTGLVNQYSGAVSMAYDQNLRMSTNLQVQAILQNVGNELRILGNGVPFDQADFQIGETDLHIAGDILTSDATVADPIQISSAATDSITFRLNETGYVYLLTADFDPSAGSEIFLTDVNDLDVGDPIYISDSVVSGDDGFYGVITAVGSSSVTIDNSSYVTGPGATFNTGSVLEEVPLVTFNSPVDGSGITRNSGFGPVLMGANSTFSLRYLDSDGNDVALPLTNATVIGNLRAIEVTVTLQAPKPLSDGSAYSATAQQTFGLRNLSYVF